MPQVWVGTWSGGRVRTDRHGVPVYVLEAQRRGRNYSLTLPVKSEADALGERALFLRDPEGYAATLKALRKPSPAPVQVPALTGGMLERFEAFKASGEHAVTPEHLKACARYLKRWQAVLDGRDLRAVTLAELRGHLGTMRPERGHVVALRAFARYLRRMGLLTTAQDASRDLEVPQARPRKAQGHVGYTAEAVEALYAAILSRPVGRRGVVRHSEEEIDAAVTMHEAGAPLAEVLARFNVSAATLYAWRMRAQEPAAVERTPAQAVRDVFRLRVSTGLHHSEVARVAEGHWKVRRLEGHGEIAGVVTVTHKRGVPHSVSLDGANLAAVERLQGAGKAPDRSTVQALMDEAAERISADRMQAGQLRHTFATLAETRGRAVYPHEAGGVPRHLVAATLGHTSPRTTGRFYTDVAVPVMIVLGLRLANAEDPISI